MSVKNTSVTKKSGGELLCSCDHHISGWKQVTTIANNSGIHEAAVNIVP